MLQDLGSAYDLTDLQDKAVAAFTAVVSIASDLYGAASSSVAAAKFGLGWTYAARGKYDTAYRYFGEGNGIVTTELIRDWSLNGLELSKNRYRQIGSDSGFIGAVQSGSRIKIDDKAGRTALASSLFETMQWAHITDFGVLTWINGGEGLQRRYRATEKIEGTAGYVRCVRACSKIPHRRLRV